MLNFLRTVRWSVVSVWHETLIGEAFGSLEKVFALPQDKDLVSRDSDSVVFRYHQDGQTFYIKRLHSTKGLRSWLGQSRLRGEWNNLKLFARLGIPAARLVAYGEERCLTRARRGALITEALKDTRDLAFLALHNDKRLADRGWVDHVIAQVADYARKMHDYRFAHNDFKWRNILVDNNPTEPMVYLIDCPTGQRWFGPFLAYRIIKDLACLDKLGKYHFSRTQRLRFFKLYRNRGNRLNSQDKKMIRRIVRFFEGRE